MSRSSRRCSAAVLGLVVLTTGLAGALVAAPPGQASVTVSESYPVPSDGVLHLTGHGYGHGHGMSQYGAQGAAKQGLSAKQILAFYYPGTTLATTTGTIRVLISADTDNDVRVLPRSGLAVRQVSPLKSYTLPTTAGIKTWRLRTVSGKTTLDYDNGSWHTYLPAGVQLSGDAEFYSPSGPVTLRVGGTTRAYRGALRLTESNTVNVLSMDDYVKGVVPREMPASWMPAAVQAQAVAARTYAAYDRNAHSTRSWQTCDTTACQVYGGYSSEDSRGNAAVAATANQVLNYGGKPAFTQFGSSSGGWLAAGSQPYLVAKADPYDGFSGNPMHTWTTTLTRTQIQKAYPSLGTLQRVLVTQRDGHGQWNGRIEEMVLDGSKANVSLTGSSFRSKFGLRQQWLTFGSGTTSTPTQPAAAPSAITARWKAIGGNKSVVGKPKGPEHAVAGGRARRFAHGWIYSKAGAGTHELYRKVATAYQRRGGPKSRLGFPTTSPRKFARGLYADFEHGVLKVRRSGKVIVSYR